jgi:hypothetical protein
MTLSSPDVHDSAKLLVRTFLDSARNGFNTCGAPGAVRRTVSVEQMTEHGLQTVAANRITHSFWVRVGFTTDRLVGELTYGDREFEIEMTCGVLAGPTAPTLYSLSEWLLALGTTEPQPLGGLWVVQSARIPAIVADLVSTFAATASLIAGADPAVFARLEEARAAREAAFQERLRKEDHARVTARARDAFRAGAYDRVVALLEPLEAELTPAERKKLDLAKRSLKSGRATT